MDLKRKNQQIRRCDFYFTKSLLFKYNHLGRHKFKSEPFNCEESILERYFCGTCQLEFDTFVPFKKHITEEHCPEERKVYETKSYICQHCTFQTYSYLHWFKHASDKCFATSSEGGNVLSEVSQFLTVENENKKWLKCERCTFKTVYKTSLKSHFIARHADDKNKRWFQCEHCTFKTLRKSGLRRHFISRHGHQERKYLKCEQCVFQTLEKSNLKKHFIAQHADDKDKRWFECEQCAFKTIHKRNLKKHIFALHVNKSKKNRFDSFRADGKNEKWFECGECTFITLRKWRLQQHFIALHAEDTDKVWFKCEQCTYKTLQKCHLKRHFIARHADKASLLNDVH